MNEAKSERQKSQGSLEKKTETKIVTALLPEDVTTGFLSLRQGFRALSQLKNARKMAVLLAIAERIEAEFATILAANQVDLAHLPKQTPSAFRDRLTLDESRLAAMVESIRQVAALADPVGEVTEQRRLANGLMLRRVRAPLGVIFMIFESRPNVITEAFSLAFKSGNAIALRGGSESANTSEVIYKLIRDCLCESGINERVFYGVNLYDRAIVEALLKKKEWIDIVVPRGGESFIEFVQKISLMPIIKNDRGLCHTYVDEEADLDMAVNVVANAKTQRPGVCNALETVLIHHSIASELLPRLYAITEPSGLKWRACPESAALLAGRPRVELATDESWDTEHLDMIINCRIVSDLREAIDHIDRHGSRHSEAIITKSEERARRFQSEVDAAAVYWNASTRFTDGYQFGLGGELGISTQKLHVRGPVGLRELTTARWIIDGQGQIRD